MRRWKVSAISWRPNTLVNLAQLRNLEGTREQPVRVRTREVLHPHALHAELDVDASIEVGAHALSNREHGEGTRFDPLTISQVRDRHHPSAIVAVQSVEDVESRGFDGLTAGVPAQGAAHRIRQCRACAEKGAGRPVVAVAGVGE